jgi:uncharacterized membrane protein
VLLSMIDYSFILMFFVLLAGLLLLVIRQKPASTEEKALSETAARPSSPTSKVTYALLAVLFVLLFAITWLFQRENSRTHDF